MSKPDEDDVPDLIILPRPQIMVESDEFEVTIKTAAISDDFRSVEMTQVAIPYCDLAEVVATLQAIMRAHGVK